MKISLIFLAVVSVQIACAASTLDELASIRERLKRPSASESVIAHPLRGRTLLPRQGDFGPCNSDCQPFSSALDACPETGFAACICTAANARNLQACLDCGIDLSDGDPDVVDSATDLADTYNETCEDVSGVPTVTVDGGTGTRPTSSPPPRPSPASPTPTPQPSPTATRPTPDGATRTVDSGSPTATVTVLPGAGTKLTAIGTMHVLGVLLHIIFLGGL